MGEAKTKLDEALSRIYVLELHRKQLIKQLMQTATLRDQFAMAALTGLLMNSSRLHGPAALTRDAYLTADAMLTVREVEP